MAFLNACILWWIWNKDDIFPFSREHSGPPVVSYIARDSFGRLVIFVGLVLVLVLVKL